MNSSPPLDESYLAALGVPPGASQKLALVNASSLAGKPVPEREWLVKDKIPMRQVTLLYGDGATGKTLIALQLAVAVAGGSDWLGELPQEGGTLILSAEDDLDETHRRLADIVGGRFRLDDLAALTIAPLAGEDALLTIQGKGGILEKTPLFAEVERIIQDLRPILLIIDTLADAFGGDEKTIARRLASSSAC